MISCMISYHIKDLTVPSPEAMAFQINQVASCLGPSTVELTLPLNATECPKLPFAPVAGNQVVLQVGVQLPCSPLHVPRQYPLLCQVRYRRRFQPHAVQGEDRRLQCIKSMRNASLNTISCLISNMISCMISYMP